MSEKAIKNPFGDIIDMSPGTEEENGGQNQNHLSNTMKNNSVQEDFVKNEFAKHGINEESLKLGLNMGKQIMKNSKIGSYFTLESLKPYFDIDNKYVLIKLRYLFLPFLKQKSVNSSDIKYNIENSDLYLPIMSFITYVLVICFITALKDPAVFNPQTLGKKLSKDFSLYIMNASITKFVMFIFLNKPLSFMEIFSLVGYKFVYMIIYVIIKNFVVSSSLKYIILALFAALSALFSKKCLDKKLSNESFKKTIILSSLIIDFLIMCLILLT